MAVIAPLVMSVAVNVFEPAVFGVIEKVFVPATSAALAGSAALASVEVMPTVSVELTTFQLASTALTVAVKAPPAVWAEGLPVLPVALPGAAVSPGIRICNLLNAAGTTVIGLLEPESASTSPAVRCAIRVSDSAFVYWTPGASASSSRP